MSLLVFLVGTKMFLVNNSTTIELHVRYVIVLHGMSVIVTSLCSNYNADVHWN